ASSSTRVLVQFGHGIFMAVSHERLCSPSCYFWGAKSALAALGNLAFDYSPHTDSQSTPPMDPTAALRLALDPSGILESQGLAPDLWQHDLLASTSSQILLNCSR